jgi:hypothetical protein
MGDGDLLTHNLFGHKTCNWLTPYFSANNKSAHFALKVDLSHFGGCAKSIAHWRHFKFEVKKEYSGAFSNMGIWFSGLP